MISISNSLLRRPIVRAIGVAVFTVPVFNPLCAQAIDLNAKYDKRSVMVPMRDGIRLLTQIYQPTDRSRDYPILLFRTPYGVGHPEPKMTRSKLGPSEHFDRSGYIFVYQDVRGQFGSEGEWEILLPPREDPSDPRATDETTDAFDTIDWLLSNVDGHNDRVGMWGISYSAWETVMAMADAHPALLAVSPQASPADMFIGDDIHHHGAFRLSYMYGWIAAMAAYNGLVTRDQARLSGAIDAYDYFLDMGPLSEINDRVFGGRVPAWNVIMEHGTYDDYWRRHNALAVLGDVRPAVLNVVGWFDAEDFRGPLDIYATVEANDRNDRNFLAVGPWTHGGWNRPRGESSGPLQLEALTSAAFQEHVEFPFFEHHLKDDLDPGLAEVNAFETGGDVWRKFDQWPPQSTKPRYLYLREQETASFDPPVPSGADPALEEVYAEFLSDPASPVPFTLEGRRVSPGHRYIVEDQRFLRDRKDVLVFEGDPLEEDLVIAGRVGVSLDFTSTGTDADWVVQVVDVHPEESDDGGYWFPVTADIFRSRFRESYETPAAIQPGEVTQLTFELPDRLHRFRAGHRILVLIHSTWFPLYDRNPQTFVDISGAEESDFKAATHRVMHRAGAASHLVLPVLPE